jgi:hypothetical protein
MTKSMRVNVIAEMLGLHNTASLKNYSLLRQLGRSEGEIITSHHNRRQENTESTLS